MEGDEKQGWHVGPMETFDGVEAAEEGRNVALIASMTHFSRQPHVLLIGQGSMLDSSAKA